MNRQQVLQFPYPAAPAGGTSVELVPGVRWLRMPLPFALDHINLWLLDDVAGWSIVDCGIGNDATKMLWEQVFAEAAASGAAAQAFHAQRVLVTHCHPDHAGLAHWLCQRFGATLCMSQAEYLSAHVLRAGVGGSTPESLLAMFRRNGLAGTDLEIMSQRGNRYRHAVPDFPLSYSRLMDGDEIDIGGHVWRVIMGYGHAPEHAALYCAELHVLISGDMVLPKISTNVSVWPAEPDGNPLQRYLDSLARYSELPLDTLVLPSHGLPFRGLHGRIEQLREHHRQRLEQLLEAGASPISAFDALPTLFQRELDEHQLFFAMGEAMAHLHCLYRRGALQRDTGADGVMRYFENTGGSD